MYEMVQEKQDLTTGSLGKKILLFSLPLMASNLLQVLFNMADVAVVGQFAGAMALGSVGSTTTLVTLFTGFLIGLAGGINVLVALRFGAKDRQGIVDTVHSSAIISLLVGLILFGIGFGFARPILNVLHTKTELLDGAIVYLRIYFFGMPALALYNFGNAVFSAVGDTKKPLLYLSFAGVLNVILNLFFVVGCHLSVAGVALASAISQCVSAGLLIATLLRSKEDYGLRLRELRVCGDITANLMRIGIPAAIQFAMFQFANLFVQIGVNSFDTVTVEGTAAAANADGLVYEMMAADLGPENISTEG